MKGPLTISLESPHYLLRTLELTDDGTAWSDWLNDTGTAAVLNVAPTRLTADDFRDYVKRFDRTNAHALGIFRRDSQKLVGIWSVYIDWPNQRFIVNLLVGEANERNQGVRAETADLIHRQFFEDLGLLTAHCSAVDSNLQIRRILETKGWRQVSREQISAPDGVTPVGILHFMLPRDVWRQRKFV
jgi:RimJ/RimL family protein N-acetyltransferase